MLAQGLPWDFMLVPVPRSCLCPSPLSGCPLRAWALAGAAVSHCEPLCFLFPVLQRMSWLNLHGQLAGQVSTCQFLPAFLSRLEEITKHQWRHSACDADCGLP